MFLNTIEAWHNRFRRQARWTANIRAYLYQQVGLDKGHQILDVGCGTGSLTCDFMGRGITYFGLDIDYPSLEFAQNLIHQSQFVQGDGLKLPFSSQTFDHTVCHFFLLWVKDPSAAIKEMSRVTKLGGSVIAFAEPDYGGRIDFPEDLTVLGEIQIESLIKQGANPFMGRRLAGIFNQTSLESIQSGILGGQWFRNPDWEDWESEWDILESDITQTSFRNQIRRLTNLKRIDRFAYEKGTRVLYVPTFYACGYVSAAEVRNDS